MPQPEPRPTPVRFLLLAGTALLLCTPSVPAQNEFAVGSIIRGFELPQRDAGGELKQLVFGEEATVITRNRIRIDGLRIDVFENQEPRTRIQSPQADYWDQEKRLTTSSGVRIQHPSFVLEAKQMDWELEGNRGMFQENVRVTLTRPDISQP